VAGAKGEQERFDTYGGKRKPLQGDTKVGYPKHGGYEEIYKSFVPHLPEVALNSEIVHIVPNGHKATTADGREYRYRFMASTMPLPRLTQITEGVPDEIVRLAQALSFMSVYVALILVGRQLETPIQRLYVADPTIPPHKIALNHNSSDYLRKRPRHAIMAEVSYSDLKPLKVDEIVPKTIDFLVSCRILNGPEDVIWHGYIDANYAYPVYTHERPKIVQQIKDWYAIHDIYTLGRFGDWEYINSDKCVMKALTLGRKLQGRYA
jgi:protoporphyrinogen oxidase